MTADYATTEDWLQGPSDLKEAEVQDVPVTGKKVKVRGLPAAFSNQASSEALELHTGRRGEQSATVNTARMEVLQFAHGVVQPKFTVEQATAIAERFGPAFRKTVEKIDELSGVNKAAIEEANARFPAGREGADNGGPTESDPVEAGDS